MRRVLTLGGLSLAVCVAAVSVWRSHSSATMSGWLSQVSVDPVCHMEIGHRITHEHGGTTYAFCTERCRALFSQNPGAYLTERCLVCALAGKKTNVDQTVTAAWQDKTYRFCSVDHRSAFQVDPAGFFLHTMWGIPGWLYYSSIGFLLVLRSGCSSGWLHGFQQVLLPNDSISSSIRQSSRWLNIL